ncbi:MAG: heavy metal-binding domain-containing protein [Blastocatellia bacterium]
MKSVVVIWGLLFLLIGANNVVCHGQVPARELAAQLKEQISSTYACPMHAEVTAAQPGKCSKCGMELQPLAGATTEEFIVKTEAFPKRIQAGAKLTLRFTIFHPVTQAQVKQFHIVHEKPFHLFLIRHDFSHFQHIHPTPQPDGSFTVETVLPAAGMYHVFCDISPVGGVAQTIHQTLVTAGFKGDAAVLQAPLKPDQTLTKTVEGLRVTLDFAPETPRTGQPALLRYKLSEAQTGRPVTDLRPYLGAWGHTLILSADATDYLHSHPLENHDDAALPRSGPSPATIYFETYFPRPGLYRIWSQFQRQDKVLTVFFDVQIAEKPEAEGQ